MILPKENCSLDRSTGFADKPGVYPVPEKQPGWGGVMRHLVWVLLGSAVLIATFLRWGGFFLISDDPLPRHVDTAVVLQGSILGEKARFSGAAGLLQQGITNRILVSIPRESYWGQSIAPIAYAYIEKTYSRDVAQHIDFCESDDVDSTEEEARVLITCINQHGWNSVVIVTSDYHTRRAGMIWRRMTRRQHSSLMVQLHAVVDPEFHAEGWWRDRRSAKTWILECTKLLWALAERN